MPPAIPVATYRLQFSAKFRFADAAALVPYLKSLGISHLYASPFLKSRAGSTHGYDVVDHNTVHPSSAERKACSFCRRLSPRQTWGSFWISCRTTWGFITLTIRGGSMSWNGGRSSFAASFDIDWKSLPGHPRGGVLIPILGSSYGEVLHNGEIALHYDARAGSFSAWYYEHRLPINPNRYGEILEKVVAVTGAVEAPPGRKLLDLATRYRGPHSPSRGELVAFKAALAAVEDGQEVIERGLRAYDPRSDEPGALLALHYLLERQHSIVWRTGGLPSARSTTGASLILTILLGYASRTRRRSRLFIAWFAALLQRARCTGCASITSTGFVHPAPIFQASATAGECRKTEA